MNYNTFFDKLYGCWLGKCICGSIGAPLEGCKQLFDYQFSKDFWKIALPNDDLELQIMYLNVIEKYGFDLTSDDLADAFCENVPYNPGEYAPFKRNYRRGIHPPVSGTYNNAYYHEGMGCCIRAEIWACIAAGDPALAAKICQIDGRLDHTRESILSECFIAALEAAAFTAKDLESAFDCAWKLLPADSRLTQLLADVKAWCGEFDDWKVVREHILRHYGHPDCTNMFQNIGITVMALFMSGNDLETATRIALDSGYDTDCTCGIAGAIYGIFLGAEKLQKDYGISDTGYVTVFDVKRRSDRILHLTEDIARLLPEAERFYNKTFRLTDVPADIQNFRLPVREKYLRFQSRYENDLPVIAPGGSAVTFLEITNPESQPFSGKLELVSNSLTLEYDPRVDIPARGSFTVKVLCRHSDSTKIKDDLKIHAVLNGISYQWGFAAAVPWQVYGPFFDNFSNVPQVDLCGKHYSCFLEKGDFINDFTALRNYHLNSRAGLDLAPEYEQKIISNSNPPAPHGRILANDDLIPLDSAFGYQGPGVFYLVQEFAVDQDMDVLISIGHTDPLTFFLDGKELVTTRLHTWRTTENINLEKIPLAKGRHRIVCKVARCSKSTDLSIVLQNSFRPGESDTAHCIGLEYFV